MLDSQSPVPLYQQLKSVLRQMIQSGVWLPNEAMPSERELIERYGVSRITVRQALADLQAEELLHRRHGKGTFVSPRVCAPIAETLSELTGHIEELQRRELDPEIEVLTLTKQPMDGEIARALERPEGSEAWFLHRRVFVTGLPLMLAEVYLPADLQIELRLEEVTRCGMAELLTQYGRIPVRGTQRIAAQTAPPKEAELLGVQPGDALMRVVRVIYGANDLPLVWFRTLYRGDRYEYEVALKRRR